MKTSRLRVLGLLGLALAAMFHLTEGDAFARAGGGGSTGSRGSRSFSSPSRPPISSPRAPLAAPRPVTPPPLAQPAPATGNPFWRGLAGGVVGGLLGGMLFRGLAGAGGFGGGLGGGGLGGSGFGLFEILLLALIAYGVYWWVKKRREQEPLPAEGSYYQEQGAGGYGGAALAEGTGAAQPEGQREEDRQRGLAHIRTMDARFDEAAFCELCTDNFFKIQAGWMNREVDGIGGLLTTEMQNEFRREMDRLKQAGRINRLENITVRKVEVTEAWQETGQDFITVRFLANLLDFTVDDKTGQVVEGNKTDPVKFEEYWTWTRPVGPNPWRLSAINQPD